MTDNQQRAAELARRVGAIYDADEPIRQALDAAEARGRAEVTAKVEMLAFSISGSGAVSGAWLRKQLHALVAEVTR